MPRPGSLDTPRDIYALLEIEPVDDIGIVKSAYIGASIDVEKRRSVHWAPSELAKGNRKAAILRKLREAGRRPMLAVLDTVPAAEAKETEDAWMELFRRAGVTLTNERRASNLVGRR